MDFIPLPDNGAEHMLVPDLGGAEYDGGDFDDYPARMGWDLESLETGDVVDAWLGPPFPSIHDAKTAARPFIQTWLFFGFLSIIFGRRVLRHEYTRTVETANGSQSSYITTKNLVKHLETWYEDITSLPKDEHESYNRRLAASVERGGDFLYHLVEHETENEGLDLVPRPIHLHLVIVHRHIKNCWREICHAHGISPITTPFAGHDGGFLARNLVKTGYCPRMLAQMSASYAMAGYYAGLLRLQDGRDHDLCTVEHCNALTIDEKTYRIRGCGISCSCRHVGCFDRSSDHQERKHLLWRQELPRTLQGMLKNGKIPLVDLDLPISATSPAGLPLVPYTPSTKYIAVSHVWADGLGNPFENALPVCQLRFLLKCIKAAIKDHNLESSGLVWMDTLCVPVRPEKSRKAAIVAMRKTYESAEAVIVLDKGLLSVNVPSLAEEIFFRIAYSDWMTRVWTYQEGVLAKLIFFQFADRSIDLDELLLVAKKSIVDPITDLDIRFELERLRPYDLLLPSPRRRRLSHLVSRHKLMSLDDVWKSLYSRSTSHDEDTPVCAATLMAIKTRPILRYADSDKRMQAFWSLQRRVPSNILFIDCPRLSVPGFRWAPRAITTDLEGTVLRDLDARPHPRHGLLVHGIDAYRLRRSCSPPENVHFFFRDSVTGELCYLKATKDSATAWLEMRFNGRKNLVLLVQDKASLESDGLTDGIICESVGKAGSVEKLSIISKVLVWMPGREPLPSPGDYEYYLEKAAAHLDPETNENLKGHPVDPAKKWYVD